MKSVIFILSFLPCVLLAQDIHFSQWMYHPIFSNPAASGFFDGDYRVHAQQRSQWSSVSVPFTSASLGMDMNLNGVGLVNQADNLEMTGIIVNPPANLR